MTTSAKNRDAELPGGPVGLPPLWGWGPAVDRIDGRSRRNSRAALPPRSFTARRTDGGVEFRIIDRNPIAEVNGSVRYDIYWAEDVDLSTAETIAAGFARATAVSSIPAPGKEGADATRTIYGERYLRGFYFCCGVDSTNVRGEPTPPISMNDSSTGGGYPDDVEHFAVSESGEVHNGVTYSVISFVYQAPKDDRFAGVEFYVKDYPVINQIYQTHFHRYRGQKGGTGQDSFKWEVGRRKGTGTISISGADITGVGTAFLSEMNGEDLVEARGHTQVLEQMGGVTSNTVATLVDPWTGDTITSNADWWAIPLVTIYAVSIGKDGSHREDIEAAPSATVYLDGLLSPPVAPVLLSNEDSNGVSTLGEINRLEWDQLAGTEMKAYHLYRGLGAAVAFADCTHIGTRDHNPHALAAGHHFFDDKDFTIVQKEQNQVWSYYLVAENWREQRSLPSSRQEVACRLNAPSGGDPTIPARSGIKNLLYNAALSGTAGNDVSAIDATQDVFNGTGGPPAGWARWEGTVNGAATVKPKHFGGDEVKLVAPSATGTTYFYQGIKGWDAAADPIVRKGALLTFQALIKHGGTTPDGDFLMYLETLDGAAVQQEYCPRRYRDPADDALKFYAAGTTSIMHIPMTDLLSTWQMFFCVFKPNTTGLTVGEVRVNWGWTEGTTGEIYVTQPQLSYGEELCNWTGELEDPLLRYPASGDPPGGYGDGPGHRKDLIDIP
mgnify:CR=1 FL=1